MDPPTLDAVASASRSALFVWAAGATIATAIMTAIMVFRSNEGKGNGSASKTFALSPNSSTDVNDPREELYGSLLEGWITRIRERQ